MASVAQYLGQYCEKQGLNTIYQYIGGMIVPMIDVLGQNPALRIVTTRTEQGAGFAAEAHARLVKKPMVAMATSGPGATNLLTAVADCYFDHVPALFICGQVNTHECNTKLGIRQLGFQETDIVSMAQPVTKYAQRVNSGDEFSRMLDEAYRIATTAPYGPVLLDIPMNVQRQECPELEKEQTEAEVIESIDEGLIADLIAELSHAERPLLLLGHGVELSDARDTCVKLSECHGIPTVHTLHGVDCGVGKHDFGLIGSYGNRYANQAIKQADLLLVLGSRLDIRQTGANVDYLEQGKRIYHVDVNPAQINNRMKNSVGIIADVKSFASQLLNSSASLPSYAAWLGKLASLKEQSPSNMELELTKDIIHPNRLVEAISQAHPHIAGYTADVGKNQMYVAQSVALQQGQRVLFSGGHGSMGFALPAAIGMCIAAEKPVVCFTGDGGLQMNIQELETIVHNRLDIKIIVFQNHALGMVQQFQEDYCENRLFGTVSGYSAPNFTAVATAYGIPARRLSQMGELDSVLDWLRSASGPCLVECVIPNEVKLFPKILFGNNLDNMYPYK